MLKSANTIILKLTHTHTHTLKHTHTNTHMYKHTHIHSHKYTHIHSYKHTHLQLVRLGYDKVSQHNHKVFSSIDKSYLDGSFYLLQSMMEYKIVEFIDL